MSRPNGAGAAKRPRRALRRLLMALCLAAALFMVSGCAFFGHRQPITNVDDLEGRDIGVTIGWGPDYMLTGRKDMKLWRYNSISGMVTALCYGRVDAIAVEKVYIPLILECIEGLRVVEKPLGVDGIVAYFRMGAQEMMEDFNRFCADFSGTPEQEDLIKRMHDMDGFEPLYIEDSKEGKVIRVGLMADAYPFTYWDTETERFEGGDAEIVRRFAHQMGYQIEYVEGTYAALESMISFGKVDMVVAGNSELYRIDVEGNGRAMLSDSYMPMEILLVEVEDREKVKVTGEMAF